MVSNKIVSFMVFSLLLFFAIAEYHQNDYRVKHRILEFLYGNRSYADGHIELVPYNRTTRALSFHFRLKKELTEELLFSFQAYKFASNEYRLFPVNIMLDFCKEHERNTFGTQDIRKYSNGTFMCPLKKGYYYLEKYRPDETKWPPYLITGDFKIDVNISYKGDDIARVAWHLTVIKNEKLRFLSFGLNN